MEDQLTAGAKELYFQWGNNHFKDSLSFILFALEDFPQTFNLTELKKGFFPHAYHVEVYLYYIGPVPDQKYYNPDKMMGKKKAKFTAWHAEQVRRNGVFDFQKELLEYCENGIKPYKEGCEKFIKEFESIAQFNPLLQGFA